MRIFGYGMAHAAHILVAASASASDFTRVARSDEAMVIRKAAGILDRFVANADDAFTFGETLPGDRPAALNYRPMAAGRVPLA